MSRRPAAAGLACALAAPSAAHAHAAAPGIEGFLRATSLPVAEPLSGLVAMALALVLVADWRRRFDRAALPVLAAFVLGAALARLPSVDTVMVAALAASALAAGWSALAGDRGTAVAIALALPLALSLGVLARPDPGPPIDVAITTAGGIVGLALPTILLGGVVDWLREAPGRHHITELGLRIAAAWVAAVAVMLLALSFRPVG